MDTGDLKSRDKIKNRSSHYLQNNSKARSYYLQNKKIEISPVANDIEPCCLYLTVCKHIN